VLHLPLTTHSLVYNPKDSAQLTKLPFITPYQNRKVKYSLHRMLVINKLSGSRTYTDIHLGFV